MLRLHREPGGSGAEGGYHILIGAGDQIYSDCLWWEMPELARWKALPLRRKVREPIPASLCGRLLDGFLDVYVRHWGRPAVAAAMARIPALYAWDDHDIMDAWGAHEPVLQESNCYHSVLWAASRAYEAVQLGSRAPEHRFGDRSHYLQAAQVFQDGGLLELILLDTRTYQSVDQMLSPRQWSDLEAWLDRSARMRVPRRHTLLVSSLPVAFPSLRWVERLMQLHPGHSEYRRELRSRWNSVRHRAERDRLLMLLFAHARRTGSPVTLLSGDIHMVYQARIVSTRAEHLAEGASEAVIDELTSSGIVHPPPPWKIWTGIRVCSLNRSESVAPGVRTQAVSVDGRHLCLRRRNWLSVDFDAEGKLAARWITESGQLQPAGQKN
jgi:phosphodiesterase/alkaline phosphatase D-like protein